MKALRINLIIAGLVLLLALTGCRPWVIFNQSNTTNWITIDADNNAGQTFVAEFAGLQAVDFYLKPASPGEGSLAMHLRLDPEATTDLAVVKLPIIEIDSSKVYRFDFPTLKNSNDQYYFAFLTVEGNGSVEVGAGPTEAYQNGSAYQNGQPVGAQLAFHLEYDRLAVLTGISLEVLGWLVVLCAGSLALVIPGWAILSVFWRGWERLSTFEKLPLSIATSLAFYSLFVLFTFLVHLNLGKWYVWLPVTAGAVVLVLKNLNRTKKQKHDQDRSEGTKNEWPSIWINASLIIILVLITLTRFWAVRGLEQPMWNNSLHHTTVTQLILDHQGLFSSWLPYAAYQSYSMHFGFSLMASILAWLLE